MQIGEGFLLMKKTAPNENDTGEDGQQQSGEVSRQVVLRSSNRGKRKWMIAATAVIIALVAAVIVIGNQNNRQKYKTKVFGISAADAGNMNDRQNDSTGLDDENSFQISDAVRCYVILGDEQILIPNHTACIHEERSGIFGDGMLFFMPLKDYIKTEKLPEFEYAPGLYVETAFDNRLSGKGGTIKVYRNSNNDLVAEENFTTFDLLPPGQYLVDMEFNVSRKKDYYVGAALFWLTVSSCDQSYEPAACTKRAQEKTPSKQDLDELETNIVYPEEDCYLDHYRYATVAAPQGHSVNSYIGPDRSGNVVYVKNGEKVTVLAEQKGFSCVIIESTQDARWVTSDYLKPIESENQE